MPSPKKYRLDEFGGSDFPSFDAARHAATNLLAETLACKIQAMLQRGDLMIENGMVVPAKNRKNE